MRLWRTPRLFSANLSRPIVAAMVDVDYAVVGGCVGVATT